jgi:sterol 3beta-glucosyltransferase
MRITLLAFGTRGDVTPCVALGIRLRDAGHAVRVATFAEYEAFVRRHGLEYHPVAGSYERLFATPEGRSAFGVPNASPWGMTGVLQPFRHCAEAVFAQCWDACADAEAVLVSNIAFLPGLLTARIRGLPLVHCQVIPSIATRELPQNSFPPWPLGSFYNRLTHSLAAHLGRWGASGVIETWLEAARRRMPRGAKGLRMPRVLALVGASPLVVPPPTDWPANAHVTGFWFPHRSCGVSCSRPWPGWT